MPINTSIVTNLIEKIFLFWSDNQMDKDYYLYEKIENFEWEIKNLESQIDDYKYTIEELETSIKDLQRQIQAVDDRIDILKGEN